LEDPVAQEVERREESRSRKALDVGESLLVGVDAPDEAAVGLRGGLRLFAEGSPAL
jgi:hypothetical protein